METKEIYETLKNNKELKTHTVEYKSKEDKQKYGLSFNAMALNEFIYIKVNGLKFKVKRVTEEYGKILFIYNFNQIEIKKEDIKTISF